MLVRIVAFTLCSGCLFAQSTGLIYARFLGGQLDADAEAIAVDSAGNAYVTGNTVSDRWKEPITDDFPISARAFFKERGPGGQGFLVKLDPSGKPVFSTLLGGSATEWGMAVRVDEQKRVYVTGRTSSDDFPATAKALQEHPPSRAEDVFVAVLDATGSRVEFSTLLGGPRSVFSYSLAATATGHAVVVGHTVSDWFVKPAIRTHRVEMGTAFIVRAAP